MNYSVERMIRTSLEVEKHHDLQAEGSSHEESIRFRQQEKILEVLKQDAQGLLASEMRGGSGYEAFDVQDGV